MNKDIITGASSDPAVEKRLMDQFDWMYTLYPTEIDLNLSRVKTLLGKLGNPHLSLPKTVHVAGTNGKGSIIATLRSILEEAGMSVHCATSPHLVHPTERLRLAGKLVTSEEFSALLAECIRVNHDAPITFFEMFMAACFLGFSRVPADYLLLETGMGGRLDATNVVTRPVCTIISMISRDHESFLGDTLPKIAREKAGIMKAGVPCVIARQTEEARNSGVLDVFHEISQGLSPAAPLVQEGADWCTADDSDRIRFTYKGETIHLNHPSLLGSHQTHNAGAALAALKIIEPGLFDAPDLLSTALQKIEWPGRLQTLRHHPFCAQVPDGWEVIIDGGHNDSAGQILATQTRRWREQDPKPLHLVCAMMNRKDAVSFLKPMADSVDSLSVTTIPGEADAYSPDELQKQALKSSFTDVRAYPDAGAALTAIDKSAPKGRILFCGSLYFIGDILRLA